MAVSYHLIIGANSSETITLSDGSLTELNSAFPYYSFYSVSDEVPNPNFLFVEQFELPSSNDPESNFYLDFDLGQIEIFIQSSGAIGYSCSFTTNSPLSDQYVDFSLDSSYINYLREIGTSSPISNLLTSLNGNFGSYIDGANVSVQGLSSRIYTVQSSSLGWDAPNTGSLILTYRLRDVDGNFLEAPHVLLSLISEP